MIGVTDMSNIPASERRPTKIDFFDRAIDLRTKIVQYIDCDFGTTKRVCPDGTENTVYWILAHIREDIYKALQDMIYCLTQANTIWITNMYEYNERRRYMTKAIGDCEYILQEIQYAIRCFNIKPEKYINLTADIEALVLSIKNWRKADNAVRNKILKTEKTE